MSELQKFLENLWLSDYYKSIKDVDLIQEYIKVRLKISKLSSTKRSLVLSKVKFLRNHHPEVETAFSDIDKSLLNELNNIQS